MKIGEKQISSIESDMKQCPYEKEDKLSSKVFKVYPLVGDYCPKDETLEKWFDVTRRYIEIRLENKSSKFYSWVYEQVTLVVVHYAKQWNSNEESRFSKYIAMQLGYKDDNGKIWNLLTDAIERSFKQHNRLFIIHNGERQFYETVMVHSFGPANSWYPLIDLLFSFYSDNLDWTYVPNDPLFRKLVAVLQNYFNNTEAEEDQYYIASQKYRLRVGVRRLVQERPGYCAHLFELLIKRMQQLIRNEASEPKRYSYSLIDQWLANRISNSVMMTEKSKTVSNEPSDLALDYTKINIRYIISEGGLALRIPAIRIVGDEKGEAVAELYEDGSLINTITLSIRGNELGETIQYKTIHLPVNHVFTDEIKYQLIIKRGGSVLFDSEKKLFRQMVFFSEGKEIGISKLRKEKYEVFIPSYNKMRVKNIDVSVMPRGMYELAFHKDYLLEYAGNVLAIDTSEIKGIRVVRPMTVENARFLFNGEEYSLFAKKTSLKIYCEGKREARKYAVIINGETHSLADYFDDLADNRSIIPLEGGTLELSVIDIAASTVVFKERYYCIPEFNYSFDQKVYVIDEDYDNLRISVSLDGQVISYHATNRDEIHVDYCGGIIVIDIPNISVSFENIPTVLFNRYIRAEDLSEQSALKITNKSGHSHNLIIDGEELGEKRTTPLFRYIYENQSNGKEKEIILQAAGQDYYLGSILYGNSFVQQPQFSYKDDCLYWDGGASYVGDVEAELSLSLFKNDTEYYTFELLLGKTLICDFTDDDFRDGQYDWVIYADNTSIAESQGFFGDTRKARFADSIIQIDFVTEDVEESSIPVPIKTVYIDQIQYKDTCFIETEDGIYDVYSGCMYWIDWNGEKRYYSFKYSDNGSRYKINPVKIIYISNKYLRIVNEDNEGIYYFYKDIPPNIGNEITDREPSAKAKNYHDILFYMFETRSTEKTTSSKQVAASNPVKQPLMTKAVTDIKLQEETAPVCFGDPLKSLQTVSQQTVINAPVESRILVNAGPGTGKTWALIERVINLVQRGVDPESIQVLCFSRAAVEVVRSRMSDAISDGRVDISINKADIRTFDSFASQLLYWVKDSDYNEIKKNFRIESLNYEQRIIKFIEVLRSQPGLIEQCEHLIVDEVQDLVLSRAEMVLNMIRLLPEDSGVTLFGDACQAIYDYQVESGMSSDDFYTGIAETGQFIYYSFDRNYRQTSKLQSYCEEYRKAILSKDPESCNNELSAINDELPEYSVNSILKFEEDSLDSLLRLGNVGILTRSNAQALYISALFHKKNIPHALQKRLADNSLAGWIAALFNRFPMTSYDEPDFGNAFTALFPGKASELDTSEIWRAMNSNRPDFHGRVPVSDLLRGIRDFGKNDILYSQIQNESITLSTIHRSKGREYDSVIVLDSLISDNNDNPEEHRVKYVALSRAKQRMYKANLHSLYFKTLDDRRCYTTGKRSGTNRFLSKFEIGKSGDYVETSFCTREGIQEYIRSHMNSLKGKEVYLEKNENSGGTVTYSLILKENDMVLGNTSAQFANDLDLAIRKIKNLPWYAQIFPYIYPKRFSGIYIVDVASEIRMPLGNEVGVREFGNLITWNTILAEGYAKAEY